MKKFKYDIAFSLLHEDLEFAKELFEVLEHYNLNVFLYVHSQKELTGKNGISVFSKTFKEQARTVVLIHRQGYGETHWTRIEHSAIQDRFLSEGPDFCLLVKRDKTCPIWYPKYMQYINSEMETKDIAELILHKVQEQGTELQPKKFEDYLNESRKRRDEKMAHYRALLQQETYTFLMNEIKRSTDVFQPYIKSIRENLNYLSSTEYGFNNNLVNTNQLYLNKIFIHIEFRPSDNNNTSQCFDLIMGISKESNPKNTFENVQSYKCNFNSKAEWGWSMRKHLPANTPSHYPKITSENGFYELDAEVFTLEYLTEKWFTEFVKIVTETYKV